MSYTKINTCEFRILQSEHPNPDVIDSMMSQKLPIIFRYEMELWDGVDELIGYPANDIVEVVKNNELLISNIKKIYLKPYTLPLTKDWTINLKSNSTVWDKLPNTPLLQSDYNYYIANLTGLMMVCLISPKHKALISSNDQFKNIINNPDTNNPQQQQLDYITIPVRPSNMLHIPYGWYYYLYCGQPDSYCTYLEMVNKTWFN